MKKITAGLLFFGLYLTLQAQDYLITFAADGDTGQVATVRVENLTSGLQATLAGTDTLHLVEAVGIAGGGIPDQGIRIYPNPMMNDAVLAFDVPQSGRTTIRITDMAGKTVIFYQDLLPAGICTFRIAGLGRGLYVVHVSGTGYASHEKLISSHPLPPNPSLILLSTAGGKTAGDLKSASAMVIMPYHEGDQLLFTGISGPYSHVVPDVPSSGKVITFYFTACTDAGGNHYPTVQIGGQTWMAANLNVGTRIDGIQNQADNGIMEKYCYQDDDQDCALHGGLYQWNELMQYATTPGGQGLCPAGWHVPTDAEWCTLTQYLDPTVNCSSVGWSGQNAGGQLKTTGTLEAGTGLWYDPNYGATNASGFSGLPSGDRSESAGFAYQGMYGFWWSSTQQNTANAWSRSPDFSAASIVRGGNQKICGFSVRCVHD